MIILNRIIKQILSWPYFINSALNQGKKVNYTSTQSFTTVVNKFVTHCLIPGLDKSTPVSFPQYSTIFFRCILSLIKSDNMI